MTNTMNTMVRHANIEDISRIAEIIVFGKRVAYRPIFQNDEVSFNELQVLDIIEMYQKNPCLLENILVYDDGIVKGIINRQNCGNETELCEFYVEPFFVRGGIGQELMHALIKEAEEEGMKRIFLWVIKDNVNARSFYEKNGFTATGEEKIIDDTPIWDVCYERRL